MARNSAHREGEREDRKSDATDGALHCVEPTIRAKECSSDVADQRLQPALQTLWFPPRMRLEASSVSGRKPPHLKQLMKPGRAEDRIAPPGGLPRE